MQLEIEFLPKLEKIRWVIHLDLYDRNDHVLMQLIHHLLVVNPEDRYSKLEYKIFKMINENTWIQTSGYHGCID